MCALQISAKTLGIVARCIIAFRRCCEVSHCGRTRTYRAHGVKGSKPPAAVACSGKAVMTAPGACTMARVFSFREKRYFVLYLSCVHRALFALVAAERDSDTSQDARDDGWLSAACDGAAGGCSQGCRKALCRLDLASYTERSSNPSAFVAVCARSFYLGSSWSSTKSARARYATKRARDGAEWVKMPLDIHRTRREPRVILWQPIPSFD